ncbi:unnamed protein product, partial [Closterium sp. NIES-64]
LPQKVGYGSGSTPPDQRTVSRIALIAICTALHTCQCRLPLLLRPAWLHPLRYDLDPAHCKWG